MGRPPLPVGTFGSISVREVSPGRFRARARVRDFDGKVRFAVKHAGSRSAAERELKQALADRRDGAIGAGEITRDSKISDLAAAWLLEVERRDLSSSTKRRYRDLVNQYILPAVGELRIRELDVAAADRFLVAVTDNSGAPTAKGARTALSGMVGLALRRRAMTSNPIPDTQPISVQRHPARALAHGEAETLLDALAADVDAQHLDLVDLVRFMLGTGARIGEAAALRMSKVDIEHGTVEISATAVRGKIQEKPKTKAGWRVLAVPASVVELIERRVADEKIRTDVVVFPSPLGKVRDTSNTTGDLRRVLDAAGFEWVTSHTFRKTVATRLDEAGLSARQIADHLGHAQPSMTQDVYMGRKVANADAAKILE